MEKRKWLWNRKYSEISPGEGESNGSFSSHSERYSDEQEQLADENMEETMKSLTAKLSGALVNVSAKEELVKQHAKVAEEAVAGWEKAENEVAALKQQIDVAVQQNLSLEVRASHLEGALRECLKQLRQARDEEKSREWESQKADLEKQILHLRSQNSAAIDPDILLVVEALEKENSSLRQEVVSRCKDLEVIAVERDLSTRAAETASKLQLESIKKVAKLEAECTRLQSLVRKSSPLSNQRPLFASSFCAESTIDSYSENGIRQRNGSEPRCVESWAMYKNLATCSVEIDMMDDFLEMERLAGLPDTENDSFCASESTRECISDNSAFKDELDSMTRLVAELKEKMGKLEAEKLRLQNALDESVDSLMTAQRRAAEAEIGLEELRKELGAVNETKELLEFQLVDMDVEARTMSSNIESLKVEIEDERKLSSELAANRHELEKELRRTIQENEVEHNKKSNGETNIKQEDLAVAADKLAECQKTIAALGRQLQSLATLEDFLIDTSNIPEASSGGDMGRLTNDEMFVPKCDLGRLRSSMESYSSHQGTRSLDLSPSLSSNHLPVAKSWGSFGRIFSRSKSVVELESSPVRN